MDIYRKKISKDLDIDNVSDKDFGDMLDETARDIVYNYLLFGEDVTYDDFVEKLKVYLKILDRIN